ncbi:MAG TPA: glycosyltransferase [Actinoplanes sp.]|jgi:glycosyltransferase involved in cell wall biosynthesis/O-antigen/teichoic acid export membrane protein
MTVEQMSSTVRLAPQVPDRRILHVINMGVTCGGAERLVADLVTAQRNSGHQVRVLASDLPGSGTRFADATWAQPGDRGGLLARLTGQFRNRNARDALARELRDWRPEVVHLHTIGLLSPSTLALLAGTPTVMTVHGPEVFLRDTALWCLPQEYFRCSPRAAPQLTGRGRLVAAVSRLAVAPVWRRRLRAVDQYIAPSRYIADLVGRDLGPARTVPNAVHHLLSDEMLSDEMPTAKAGHRVLFAGRLEYFKGPQLLIEALPQILREHPATTVRICGSGPMAEPLRELVDRLGLGASVELIGWLDLAQLRQEMTDADVVVMPSLWPEAFGLSCLEALAVGTPVVASAVGGLPDLIRPDVTGLLAEPGDVAGLASAVSRLLGDDALRARLGEQGRQMSAGYTMDAHRRGMDQAYADAVAGPRKPSAGGIGARLRAAWQDVFIRNSVMLLLATVELAAGGFLFWRLVAQVFTPEQVGLAGTLISASSLVATLAMLGMNNSLIRYLAEWPERARTVSSGAALVAVASVAGSLIFAAGTPWFAPPLTGTLHGPAVLGFIVLTVAGAVGTLYDNVFVALRSSGYVLARNTVAVLLRLALPLGLVGLGGMGIFTAYWLAFALGVVIYMVALQRRFGMPLRSPVSLARLRAMWRYSLGTYLATVILMVPSLVMPILVAQRNGLREAASYYIAALLASILLFIPEATSRSFFAEASHHGSMAKTGLWRVLLLIAGTQTPILLALILLGRPVLALFGDSYATAYPLLVILAVTNVLGAVGFVGSTVLLITRRIGLLCVVSAVAYGVALGGSLLFGGRGSLWIAGSLLTGETILAAAYLGVIARAVRGDR